MENNIKYTSRTEEANVFLKFSEASTGRSAIKILHKQQRRSVIKTKLEVS